MRKLLLAAASVAAVTATAASAQALEFNVGGFGGFARAETEWDYNPPPVPTIESNGGMFGVNVGVGTTVTSFYIGAEADYAWASINGSEACPNPSWSCKVEVESLATLRLRLGHRMGSWLFYGTGGVAQADVRVVTQDSALGFPSGPEFGETQSRDGWAAGLGVERKVGPHLSWRAEYLRVELDDGTSAVDFGQLVETETTLDALRFGVNWTF